MPSFAQWDPIPLDILIDTLKALGLEASLASTSWIRAVTLRAATRIGQRT